MGKGGIAHRMLIEQGREILKNMGYDDYDIYQEYSIRGPKDIPFRCVVDIVGLSQDKTVAIECGSLNSNATWRFSALRSFFDKVIWLPYLTTGTSDYDREGIRTIEEMKMQLDEDMKADSIHQMYMQELDSKIKVKEGDIK